MIKPAYGNRSAQRGIVLVTSLLLLLVVTIMALSMFRSFGIQEKISGNMREKQRALQAAVTAEQYAEYWLGNNVGTSAPVTCSSLLSANLNEGQICTNQLPRTTITNVPWNIGVTILPLNMQISGTTSVSLATLANPTYFSTPIYYIADLGASIDPNYPGEIYQVDAAGFGGGPTTAAVVESTYAVYTSSSNRTL